ncbi:hypothetical protein AK812_SmicGene8569 [Symbiodinium microadriaticum]|uniref:Uncharacterized protein n=1 Tax=Symbiodinium microadriaticum TaxID=2951 RepID=A0A1Q9EKL9_SYMMI|nr:hypothetical protein AK812_SmicGene8569 [Symbiodinium microadriaticum]
MQRADWLGNYTITTGEEESRRYSREPESKSQPEEDRNQKDGVLERSFKKGAKVFCMDPDKIACFQEEADRKAVHDLCRWSVEVLIPCSCSMGQPRSLCLQRWGLKFALIWRLAATLAWFCLAAETCLMQMKAASTTVIEVPTQLDMSRQMTEARLALGATMDFPALSHVSMDLKSVNTPGLVFLEKLRARCAKMHMVSVTSHDAR